MVDILNMSFDISITIMLQYLTVSVANSSTLLVQGVKGKVR